MGGGLAETFCRHDGSAALAILRRIDRWRLFLGLFFRFSSANLNTAENNTYSAIEELRAQKNLRAD